MMEKAYELISDMINFEGKTVDEAVNILGQNLDLTQEEVEKLYNDFTEIVEIVGKGE